MTCTDWTKSVSNSGKTIKALLLKLSCRYDEAAPLLETIFYIREKLVTISHVTVLECVVELVACLAAIEADDNAYRGDLMTHSLFMMVLGWI